MKKSSLIIEALFWKITKTPPAMKINSTIQKVKNSLIVRAYENI
jgi:hypothetical protein